MKAQLAALMERTDEPELVTHSTEQVSNKTSQRYDVIARRAFDIFESRGRLLGHELEDWFRAESELLHPVPLNVTESDGEYIVRAESGLWAARIWTSKAFSMVFPTNGL